MNIRSSMSKTFGRGVWMGAWVEFQDEVWTLQGWIWDRPEFQTGSYTSHIHNLAIF